MKLLLKVCLILLFISCTPITYHKRIFKKFTLNEIQNHLLMKNGYYFFKTKIYRYDNFVKSEFSNAYYPTDSVLNTSITGMIFYEKNRVYVTNNYFDGLEHTQKNSLEVAQNKLEKEIDKYNLKNFDKRDVHISALGKYSIQNDTIPIQYFRIAPFDKYLTQLRGVIKSDKQFLLFERKDFQQPIFFLKSKPKLSEINNEYTFKEY